MVDVDVPGATVVVGDAADLLDPAVTVAGVTWTDAQVPDGTEVRVQCSAHGAALPGVLAGDRVVWHTPQRRIAPGQSVVFYDLADVRVLGGGTAVRSR